MGARSLPYSLVFHSLLCRPVRFGLCLNGGFARKNATLTVSGTLQPAVWQATAPENRVAGKLSC